jgi:hypothetical protein
MYNGVSQSWTHAGNQEGKRRGLWDPAFKTERPGRD